MNTLKSEGFYWTKSVLEERCPFVGDYKKDVVTTLLKSLNNLQDSIITQEEYTSFVYFWSVGRDELVEFLCVLAQNTSDHVTQQELLCSVSPVVRSHAYQLAQDYSERAVTGERHDWMHVQKISLQFTQKERPLIVGDLVYLFKRLSIVEVFNLLRVGTGRV